MSKPLAALLAVSLVFNAMFAIGYFSARTTADTKPDNGRTADIVAERLGLNDAQREQFAALRKEGRERGEELNQATLLAQESLWLESCSPGDNAERVQKLKEDLYQLHEARRKLEFEQLNKFLEILTPEQRERMGERLRRPHGPRPPWAPRFGRFDADRDGRLSPDERDKAMGAMRKRFGYGPGRPGHGPRGMGPGPRWHGPGRGRAMPPAPAGPPPPPDKQAEEKKQENAVEKEK